MKSLILKISQYPVSLSLLGENIKGLIIDAEKTRINGDAELDRMLV